MPDPATLSHMAQWSPPWSPVWWLQNLLMVWPWLLAWLAMTLAVWPLVRTACPHLRQGGWALAKVMALLLPAWFTWLARSAHGGGVWTPTAVTSGFVPVILLMALGGLRWWREREVWVRDLRRSGRSILGAEAGFLLAALLFVGIRAQSPAIAYDPTHHAGEKFTDFALFNTLLKDPVAPPEHPWMLATPLNYYYFGHLMWSLPAGLLGTQPQSAFNIALCLVMALIWLLVFASIRQLGARPAWAFVASWAVTLGGPPHSWGALVKALGAGSGVSSFLGGYYFWGESRCVSGAITEFPSFSLILGDLHAHVMGLPLLLAFVLWLLQWPSLVRRQRAALGEREEYFGPASVWTSWWPVGIHVYWPPALLVGAMSATNAWDAVSAAIVTGAMLLVMWRVRRVSLREVIVQGGLMIAAAVIGMRGLFAAMARTFRPPVGGPVSDGASALRTLTPFDWVPMELRTAPAEFASYFAPFLFGLALVVLWRGGRLILAQRSVGRAWATSTWVAVLAWAACGTVWLALALPREAFESVTQYPGWVGALLALALAAGFGLPSAGPGAATCSRRALLVAGVALAAVAEAVYLDDVFSGGFARINTVFKLYYAAWPILGIATSACLAAEAERWWRIGRLQGGAMKWGAVVGASFLAIGPLLLVGLYPVAALASRAQQYASIETRQQRSLDGWDFHATLPPAERDDYRAIIALARMFPRERPRLMEATEGNYGFNARFSCNLGWPIPLGWEQHLQSWVPWSLTGEIDERRKAVALFYRDGTPQEALAVLRIWQIHVVAVGSVERRLYGEATADRLASFLAGWRAIDFGGTRIFVSPDLASRIPAP